MCLFVVLDKGICILQQGANLLFGIKCGAAGAGMTTTPVLFRDMADDFAIIPMPKLEEQQEHYTTSIINTTFSITTIPITNNRLEHTGILLEELCWRGKKDLYPEMFETVLKSKIARDENSIEMIDLIFSNTMYDAGFLYAAALNGAITSQFSSGAGTFASSFASLRPSVEASVSSLLDALE